MSTTQQPPALEARMTEEQRHFARHIYERLAEFNASVESATLLDVGVRISVTKSAPHVHITVFSKAKHTGSRVELVSSRDFKVEES